MAPLESVSINDHVSAIAQIASMFVVTATLAAILLICICCPKKRIASLKDSVMGNAAKEPKKITAATPMAAAEKTPEPEALKSKSESPAAEEPSTSLEVADSDVRAEIVVEERVVPESKRTPIKSSPVPSPGPKRTNDTTVQRQPPSGVEEAKATDKEASHVSPIGDAAAEVESGHLEPTTNASQVSKSLKGSTVNSWPANPKSASVHQPSDQFSKSANCQGPPRLFPISRLVVGRSMTPPPLVPALPVPIKRGPNARPPLLPIIRSECLKVDSTTDGDMVSWSARSKTESVTVSKISSERSSGKKRRSVPMLTSKAPFRSVRFTNRYSPIRLK